MMLLHLHINLNADVDDDECPLSKTLQKLQDWPLNKLARILQLVAPLSLL